MELFFIGWRNVFRNRRRSVLNIIALSLGIILMIVYIGWMRGYFTGLFNNVINFETGHIQILNRNYLAEIRRQPLDQAITDYRDLRRALLEDSRIVEVAGRIDFEGTLTRGSTEVPVQVRAIDPAREAKITILAGHITGGTFLQKPGLLIGQSLADKLGLEAGSSVILTATDRYGVENPAPAQVVGLFFLGYPAMDENVVFTDLGTAQSLLDMGTDITRAVIRLQDTGQVNSVLRNINANLKEPLRAYPWQRFAQVVVSAAQQDGASFAIMTAICFILIIIGIINSMSMSVQERTMEIGTLRAIGMKKRGLVMLFIFEALSISVIAAVIALVVSLPLAAFLQYVGFNLEGLLPENIPLPFGSRLTSDFRWYDFPLCVLLGSLTAVISTIFPARRAAKTTIARAMNTMTVE